MKITLFFFCLMTSSLGLMAQNPVTVLSGQVLYYPQKGANPILKTPGTQFDLHGELSCKGSESVNLVYKGHYIWLKGGKRRSIQDVVSAAVKSSEMSFTGRFLNFLTESVKEGENLESVKKHHRKYMSKSSGGIKGYAKKEYAISALLISTGKLPSTNVIFKWRQSEGNGPYSFHLQAPNGTQIAELLVRDTFITLDLSQLSMDIFAEYEWRVTRDKDMSSVSMPIEICPNKVQEVLDEISSEEYYQKAELMAQQLMLAYALEQEMCLYSANSTYLNLISQNPDNLLLRKMYATFLSRMDMLPEANALISR